MTFKRTDILLPKFSGCGEKMNKWSVVACDQYTSEPEYWNEVINLVGDSPSTLKLTVPEIFLEDSDIENRIADVNHTMNEYVSDGIFNEYKNSYIFVERTLANGVRRLGIVGAVDLEDYDYSKGSKTKIRATEGTVVSRIPPRLKVREHAGIELPHIMMLIDDEKRDIIEYNDKIKSSFEKLYDFELMMGSGHIAGYRLSDEAAALLDKKLSGLDDIDSFNQKYGVNEKNTLIYAMGDGNHSLATAKAHYEHLKETKGEAEAQKARYALCELVNLHDESLVFEAIHRVIFDVDPDLYLKELGDAYDLDIGGASVGQSFVFVSGGEEKRVTIKNPSDYLTVATIQSFTDEYISRHGGRVDYIHGEGAVRKLCIKERTAGIILNAMDKSDLYKSVIVDGALPRKTFSMGEASDKRFYVEAHRII